MPGDWAASQSNGLRPCGLGRRTRSIQNKPRVFAEDLYETLTRMNLSRRDEFLLLADKCRSVIDCTIDHTRHVCFAMQLATKFFLLRRPL